jgi:hypothetical protein
MCLTNWLLWPSPSWSGVKSGVKNSGLTLAGKAHERILYNYSSHVGLDPVMSGLPVIQAVSGNPVRVNGSQLFICKTYRFEITTALSYGLYFLRGAVC